MKAFSAGPALLTPQGQVLIPKAALGNGLVPLPTPLTPLGLRLATSGMPNAVC